MVSYPDMDVVSAQTTLPSFLYQYFWDVDPTKIDLVKHKSYVVERIMIWGNEEAFRWLITIFGERAVRDVLQTSSVIDKKTATFFAYLYDLPQEEVRCLQKPSRQRQNVFWPH